MRNRSICLTLPVAVGLLSLAAVVALGLAGWPGTIGVAGMDFCEASRAGIIKQPANTLSNLGFMIAGLLIGWAASRDDAGNHPDWQGNPMRRTVFYPTFYAAVAMFLGPGSMALHASTTWWGGKVDVFSMFMWISFPIAYGIARLRQWSVRGFLFLYVPLVIALGAYLLVDRYPGRQMFGILIGVFVAIEVAIFRSFPDNRIRRLWLGAAAAMFGLAFAIWIPSRTGAAWCNPTSWLQGHAAWHLLDAGAVGAIFMFYRSEQPRLTDDAEALAA